MRNAFGRIAAVECDSPCCARFHPKSQNFSFMLLVVYLVCTLHLSSSHPIPSHGHSSSLPLSSSSAPVGKFFDFDGFFDQDAFDGWMGKVLKDFEQKEGKPSTQDPHLNFAGKLYHFLF